MTPDTTPGKELLLQARIAFLKQGTSLNRWCRENDCHPSYAYQALTGKGEYPSVLAMRKKILIAAGLLDQPKPKARKKQA